MMDFDFITRRRFLFSLAASAVAAGTPLPIGWPTYEDKSIYVKSLLPDGYYVARSLLVNNKTFHRIISYEGATGTITVDPPVEEQIKESKII